MKMSTVFDDLADLALIEILSCLSSADALWAFASLNDRWTRLLAERGFFRQVDLSTTYCRQFDQLLEILPLNNIEVLGYSWYRYPSILPIAKKAVAAERHAQEHDKAERLDGQHDGHRVPGER